MSTIQQILPGEPGYVDYGNPGVAEPPRPITPPSTPEADRVILNSIATVVESLIKEVKRKPTPERVSQIDNLLKAKTPALMGEVVATRRLKTGVDRLHSDQFESVKEARRRLVGITLAQTHDELVRLAAEALETFRGECQNEATKI